MYFSSIFILIFAILASAKKKKRFGTFGSIGQRQFIRFRLEKILLPTPQIGAESCLDPMNLNFQYSFRDLHNLLETMGKDNFEWENFKNKLPNNPDFNRFFYCYKSYLDSGNALVKAHFYVSLIWRTKSHQIHLNIVWVHHFEKEQKVDKI